jgi:hypothetical protein
MLDRDGEQVARREGVGGKDGDDVRRRPGGDAESLPAEGHRAAPRPEARAVDEQARGVRVSPEDPWPVGPVSAIVLTTLVTFVLASFVSCPRPRRERKYSRDDSDDSPV